MTMCVVCCILTQTASVIFRFIQNVTVPFTFSFAPAESDIDATIDEHIYTSASETDYEPVDPVVHSKTNDDDELLYNLAYGTGEVDTQAESTEQTFDGNDLELKDNACYGSVSSTPIPDEGEYSFPSDYEPVQLNDDSLS